MNKCIFIFFTFVFAQSLDVNSTFYDKLYNEMNAISNQEISNDLFFWPLKEKSKQTYYNLLDNYEGISISPIFGIRGSSSGFEINNDVPLPIIWVSPGVSFTFNHPILISLNPIWLNGWFKFHKHSAYGLDKNLIMEGSNTLHDDGHETLFQYNPNFEYGFYMASKLPKNNGIDFDESIGALSILSDNFDLTFGKLKASLGPSVYSNLTLSHNIPAFNQIRTHYNLKDKIYFTFIMGDLNSLINDTIDYYGASNRSPILPRRVYNHRLDFKITNNVRLGVYEQIITMSKNLSFSYMNPFNFYWSEQHQSGDLDNLQLGFDFDWIIGNNRIYGGLLIDEWAPYDTFNEDARNWFANQIGISRFFNFNIRKSSTKNAKYIKGLVKFEYSSAEPQVYIHKFEINNAYHHGYPIGLWSGGDSIDKRLNLIIFLENKSIIDFGWHNTRIGTPIYDENVSLLSDSANIKVRNLFYCQFKTDVILANYDTNIDLYFKITSYNNTENLYLEDNFLDITTSLIYNLEN